MRRHYRDAADCFREATECNPKHIQSWQAWAIVSNKLGDHEQSEMLFKKALKVGARAARQPGSARDQAIADL